MKSMSCARIAGVLGVLGLLQTVALADRYQPTAEETAAVVAARDLAVANKNTESLQALDAIVKGGSKWDAVYSLRAQVRQRAGDAPGAAADFEAALNLDAGSSDAALWKAEQLVAAKDPVAAFNVLKTAYAARPEVREIIVAMGNVMIQAGHAKEAADMLIRASPPGKSIEPLELQIQRMTASAYLTSGDIGEAYRIVGLINAATHGTDLESQNLLLQILNQGHDGVAMLFAVDGMRRNAELLKLHPEMTAKFEEMRKGLLAAWVQSEGPILPLVYELRATPGDANAEAALADAVERVVKVPDDPWAALVLPTHIFKMQTDLGKPAEGQAPVAFCNDVLQRYRANKVELPPRPLLKGFGGLKGAYDELRIDLIAPLAEAWKAARWDEVIANTKQAEGVWPTAKMYRKAGFALMMKQDYAGAAKSFAIGAGLEATETMENPVALHDGYDESIRDQFAASKNRCLASLDFAMRARDGALSGEERLFITLPGQLERQNFRDAIHLLQHFFSVSKTGAGKGGGIDMDGYFQDQAAGYLIYQYQEMICFTLERNILGDIAGGNMTEASELVEGAHHLVPYNTATRVDNALVAYYEKTGDAAKRDEALARLKDSCHISPETCLVWGKQVEGAGNSDLAMLVYNNGARGMKVELLSEASEKACAAARDRLEAAIPDKAWEARYLGWVNGPDKPPIEGNTMLRLYAIERIPVDQSNGAIVSLNSARAALSAQLFVLAMARAESVIRYNYAQPDEAWDIWCIAGLGEDAANLGAKVVENADKGIAFNPRNADLYFQKAKACLAIKEPEKALDALNHTLALSPHFAAALRLRIPMLDKAGKLKEAIADIETLKENGDDEVILEFGAREIRLRRRLIVQLSE